ncbi:MAG: 7TM diverse intracellular signaling domain-containing protein, partial [Bacteroidota bacterium]
MLQGVARWVLFLGTLCGTLGLYAQTGLIKLDPKLERLSISDSLIYIQMTDDSLPPLEGIWTRYYAEMEERFAKQSALWTRLYLSSTAQDTVSWWIDMPPNDLIDVYWGKKGQWDHQRTGARVKGDQKLNRRGYRELAKIVLAPQETGYLYIRVEELEKTVPSISFLFREEKTHQLETAYSMFNTLISNGVFFGVLFIIALYHLMLYFSIRERAYLYYTLYVLTVGLGIMVDGILSPFTTISLSGIEWFYVFYWLITLISIFYYLFAQAYLKTKELLPKWHRYIFLFIGFKLVVVLLGFLLRIWT